MKTIVKIRSNLVWNVESKALYFENVHIKLSKSETILLDILINNINKPVTCEVLFYEIFDDNKLYAVQSVRVLISKVRKKIPFHIIENVYGSEYVIRNSSSKDYDNVELGSYLFEILDQIEHGVVITDPALHDNPVIFVNQHFLKTYEFSKSDIIGKNCRVLQHTHTDQKNKLKVKQAIKEEKSVTTHLINYKKDSTKINIELTVNPIFDRKKGILKYFLGMQKIL